MKQLLVWNSWMSFTVLTPFTKALHELFGKITVWAFTCLYERLFRVPITSHQRKEAIVPPPLLLWKSLRSLKKLKWPRQILPIHYRQCKFFQLHQLDKEIRQHAVWQRGHSWWVVQKDRTYNCCFQMRRVMLTVSWILKPANRSLACKSSSKLTSWG